MKFRNKKTGVLYVLFAFAIDTTNERDGTQVVLYHKDSKRLKPFYVREYNEFFDKFEEILEDQCTITE